MENFDMLDCTGRKTGEIISRDEAHSIGAWHGAFHCLLIYESGGSGFVLFQKRSNMKKIASGKFDVSVGGHYASGEDARIAGPREIKEEIGIEVQFDELVPLGRRVFVHCFTPGIKEHEFQDVFLLPRKVRLEDLLLQREELDGVITMDVEQGIQLFSGKMHVLELVLNKSDGSQETFSVHAGDFVSNMDNYYLKLLLLARRYFRGERELLVI